MKKRTELIRITIFSFVLFFAGTSFALAGLLPEESCESLYKQYGTQISQYDTNKDGKISSQEVIAVLNSWLSYKISSEAFFGISNYCRQNCSVGAQVGNQPLSGTLSASAKTVGVGENITLTVTGRDQDGVVKVWAWYKGGWHEKACNGESECSASFTFSENSPGTYKYYGYVYGVHPQQKLEGIWTTPGGLDNPVTVEVKKSVAPGPYPYPTENYPVSGTISATPTTVKTNEKISLTVVGRDQNGVEKIWAHYQGSWHVFNCNRETECSFTWEFNESQAGERKYYGYVDGTKPDGSLERTYTTPDSVTVKVTEGTSPSVVVGLPKCSFSDSQGIWVKPKDCDWSSRILLGSGKNISCKTVLLLEHVTSDWSQSSPGTVYTVGPAAVGEGTDLCKVEPVSSEILPKCPFSGQAGEVWVKPRFKQPFFEWTWEQGRCKLGSECAKKNSFNFWEIAKAWGLVTGTEQSVKINFWDLTERLTGKKLPDWLKSILSISLTFDRLSVIGPELYTHSDTPGRAWCGMKMSALTGALPCDFCIVR